MCWRDYSNRHGARVLPRQRRAKISVATRHFRGVRVREASRAARSPPKPVEVKQIVVIVGDVSFLSGRGGTFAQRRCGASRTAAHTRIHTKHYSNASWRGTLMRALKITLHTTPASIPMRWKLTDIAIQKNDSKFKHTPQYRHRTLYYMTKRTKLAHISAIHTPATDA